MIFGEVGVDESSFKEFDIEVIDIGNGDVCSHGEDFPRSGEV